MPCDAACMKIIINTMLMAVLAHILADEYAAGADTSDGSRHISEAASRLSVAANAYREMLRDLGITVKLEADWEGCEQAQALVRWIVTDEQPDIESINTWNRAIWSAIADLAAGKLPG